MGFRYFIQH